MLLVHRDLQSNRSKSSLSTFFPSEAVGPIDTSFFGYVLFFSEACCHALDTFLKSFLLRLRVL